MPIRQKTERVPRAYCDRNQLLAAALAAGIPDLTTLAQRVDVARPVLSRVANGRDPLSDRLETRIRRALGTKDGPAPWVRRETA